MSKQALSLMQCPQNELELKHMEIIPYTNVVRSLMYVQISTGETLIL